MELEMAKLMPLQNQVLRVFEKCSVFSKAVKVVTETVQEIPPNGILVKNLYVGVNATDLNVTAGRYFKHGHIPYQLGIEALGQIVQLGANVVNYRTGQYVVVKPSKMRAYAQYMVLNEEDHLTEIPKPNPNYLTLIGTSGLTAAIGLSESAKIKEGDTVLITAAAGGLGHLAAQWAQLKGCRVIALTSTDEKAKYLKSLNFERVINYRKENLDVVLKREYPKGIDVIWETVGTPLFEQMFEHLARKGRLVNVGATAGYKTVGYANINIEDFIVKLHYGARTIIGFLVMDYKSLYAQYAKELIDLYEKGSIQVKCDFGNEKNPFQGLDGIFQAIEHLHSGKNIGKVLVKLN